MEVTGQALAILSPEKQSPVIFASALYSPWNQIVFSDELIVRRVLLVWIFIFALLTRLSWFGVWAFSPFSHFGPTSLAKKAVSGGVMIF